MLRKSAIIPLLPEAIQKYSENKKWEHLYYYGYLKATEQGFTKADADRLIDEYRSEKNKC